MKKLLVILLLVVLCCSAMMFASCEEAIFTAEEMMVYCNDSLTTNPLTGVYEVVISADLYAVAVHNVPGDKVTIDFTYHEKTSVTTEIKNSTLYIIQESEPLTMYIGGTLCLVVGIPESWTDYTLGADLGVGTLSVEDSKASHIEVDVDTGAAKISVVDATSVILESDTGAIIFQGKTGVLTVDVDTGAVKLEGQADVVAVTSDTGSIKVDMLATDVSLETDTGSIVFEIGNNNTIKVESSTGSVIGTIDGVKSKYSILVDVDTGSCNVDDQIGDSVHLLQIKINTGAAKITFTN